MFTDVISYIAVGAVLAVLGLLTWKKQKVSFLHRYHYKNVKEEDIPAYTRQMGVGQILVGAGLCLTGVLRLFVKSPVFWAPFAVGGVIGLFIMHKAQMKYNGSWFG